MRWPELKLCLSSWSTTSEHDLLAVGGGFIGLRLYLISQTYLGKGPPETLPKTAENVVIIINNDTINHSVALQGICQWIFSRQVESAASESLYLPVAT
jgi:hypothetical protein